MVEREGAMSSERESPVFEHDEVPGPTRGALIIALVDRMRHDQRFRNDVRRDPVTTVAQWGLRLRDSEWAGLRDFLVD
jgi:hypothetical protein